MAIAVISLVISTRISAFRASELETAMIHTCTLPASCLTCGRQLRHTANIGTLQELGLAVVNVLHLDDKL